MDVEHYGNLRLRDMIDLFNNALRVGVQKETSRFGIIGIYINKTDAYQRYGRTTVDRWIKERLVSNYKTKPKKEVLKLAELQEISSKSNRVTYLPSPDR